MAETGWIQDVVAIILRDNVNRCDRKTDVILAVESVHKVTDASSSAKSCIEMKDDLDFDVGTVVDKVLVKGWRCCGCWHWFGGGGC